MKKINNKITVPISVIVPCYNGAEVLSRCLDSLLNQTVLIKEIIVVNDGSLDNTAEIAENYAKNYNCVHVIHLQNGGLPQARKKGLAHAHCQFIGFVDSDDWVEPTMYDKLYQAIIETKADISSCGLYKVYNDVQKKREHQNNENGAVLDVKQAFHAIHSRTDVFQFLWNKLYRRELFEGVDFPFGNFTGEDYVTIVQIIKKSKKIVVLNEPLYDYWQSSISMSRGGFKSSYYISQRYYAETEEWLSKELPDMVLDIQSYVAVEYMSIVLAMARGNKYDEHLLTLFQKYVRQHTSSILRCKDCSLIYKGSAVLFSIHYKLFCGLYRWVQRLYRLMQK